jgi:hypothetical protein
MAVNPPEAFEADTDELDSDDASAVATDTVGTAKQAERHCQVCDVKLSSYNPGPNCWSHTIGYPWRGPTAKPKY